MYFHDTHKLGLVNINQDWGMRYDPNAQFYDKLYGCYVPITEIDQAEAVIVEASLVRHDHIEKGEVVVHNDLETRPKLAPIPVDFSGKSAKYYPTRIYDTWWYSFPTNSTLSQYVAKPVLLLVGFDFDSSVELQEDWTFTVDTGEILTNAVVVWQSLRGRPSLYTKKALYLLSGVLKQLPTFKIGVSWRVNVDRSPNETDDSLTFGLSFQLMSSFGVLSLTDGPPRNSASSLESEDYVVL